MDPTESARGVVDCDYVNPPRESRGFFCAFFLARKKGPTTRVIGPGWGSKRACPGGAPDFSTSGALPLFFLQDYPANAITLQLVIGCYAISVASTGLHIGQSTDVLMVLQAKALLVLRL